MLQTPYYPDEQKRWKTQLERAGGVQKSGSPQVCVCVCVCVGGPEMSSSRLPVLRAKPIELHCNLTAPLSRSLAVSSTQTDCRRKGSFVGTGFADVNTGTTGEHITIAACCLEVAGWQAQGVGAAAFCYHTGATHVLLT